MSAAYAADLLERPGAALPVGPDGSVRVALAGAGVATVVLVPGIARPPAEVPLLPDREPVQPVFVGYWQHNSGPAPAGNLPVTVHADPSTVDGSRPVDPVEHGRLLFGRPEVEPDGVRFLLPALQLEEVAELFGEQPER